MGKAFTATFPNRQTVALVGLAAQACGAIGDEGEAFDVAFLQGRVYGFSKACVQFGKRVLVAPHVGKHARCF